jgi:hypothetical protein
VVAWRFREGVLDIEVPCAGTVACCGAEERTLAFVEDQLRVTRKLMGFDSWSYCVAENEHVVERFVARHDAEGLSGSRAKARELFHPTSLERNAGSILSPCQSWRHGADRICVATEGVVLSTSRSRCTTMLKW